MRALIEAARKPEFSAQISLVLSDNPDAPGLAVAREAGVVTGAIDFRSLPGKEEFEAALHTQLVATGVELVCLAGFMRILEPQFC